MKKGGKAGLMLIVITLVVAMIAAWRFYPIGASSNSMNAIPATRPVQFGPNAAYTYREAIELVGSLQADATTGERIRAYDQGSIDAEAPGIFEKYASALESIREAAGIGHCDWGDLAMDARLAHLNGMRSLSNLVFAHARFAESRKDQAGTLDDLFAAMAMARHIGMGRLITDMQVAIALEMKAIDRLAAELGSIPQDQLAKLGPRLNALPAATSGREMIDAERLFAGASAPQAGAGIIVGGMVGGLQDFYRDMSAVIDQQPPAEFAVTVNAAMAKRNLNSFVQLHGPQLIRMRENSAGLEAKRAMLLTAIEIESKGEAAVAQSKDPFGEGPFGYVKSGDGFELVSKITSRGGPVKLTVGGQ